jgi:diguanylate cyclase
MLAFILFISLVNVTLGFSLAVASSPNLRWPSLPKLRLNWRWKRASKTVEEPLPTPAVAVVETAPVSATPSLSEVAAVEELPTEWLDDLQRDGIVAQSFVEASVQVLRLEVGRYREQLITAESRTKSYLASSDAAALVQLRDDLKFINTDWLSKQTTAADMLADRRGRLGDFETQGVGLEQVLLDQTAQIESTSSNLDQLDFQTDAVLAGRRMLIEVSRLIDLAHTLRDRMHDTLATIMRSQERLDTVDKRMQLDSGTGLLNRVGLEVLLHEWWRDDPQRQRLVSVVLVDIDRFSRLNERLGTRAGDRCLIAFSELISHLVRRDRGFDRVVRHAGQQLLLFLGDTGPRNATSAVERMRQTIEATTFDYQGTEFELTISSGVLEISRDDDLPSLVGRLELALRQAKKGGRNRTSLDEGKGAALVDPPQFQVKGRVVKIDD